MDEVTTVIVAATRESILKAQAADQSYMSELLDLLHALEGRVRLLEQDNRLLGRHLASLRLIGDAYAPEAGQPK